MMDWSIRFVYLSPFHMLILLGFWLFGFLHRLMNKAHLDKQLPGAYDVSEYTNLYLWVLMTCPNRSSLCLSITKNRSSYLQLARHGCRMHEWMLKSYILILKFKSRFLFLVNFAESWGFIITKNVDFRFYDHHQSKESWNSWEILFYSNDRSR